MNTRIVLVVALILGSLAGCGRSSNSPPPAPPAKADIIVTVDGDHHVCLVAKTGESAGSTIGCADVLSFVRDELRMASGAAYDLRTVAPVDSVEVNKVKTALNGAGYRFIGTSDAG